MLTAAAVRDIDDVLLAANPEGFALSDDAWDVMCEHDILGDGVLEYPALELAFESFLELTSLVIVEGV